MHYNSKRFTLTGVHGMQEGEEQGAAEDPKLRIAWQYRRYIQRQRQQQPGAPSQPPHGLIPSEGRSTPSVAPKPSRQPAGVTGSAQGAGGGSSRSSMRDWAHGFDLSRSMEGGPALQRDRLSCAGHRGPAALQGLVQGACAFVERLPHAPGGASAAGAVARAPPTARSGAASRRDGHDATGPKGVAYPFYRPVLLQGLLGAWCVMAWLRGALQGSRVGGPAGDRGLGQRGLAPRQPGAGRRSAEGGAATEAAAGVLALRGRGLRVGRCCMQTTHAHLAIASHPLPAVGRSFDKDSGWAAP